LDVLENFFTYEGRVGREIVFVFEARLADPTLCAESSFEVVDSDGARHQVGWVDFVTLAPGEVRLYPPGLLELMEIRGARSGD